MNVQVVLASQSQLPVVAHLWPLYLYDLSEFDGALPNAHGLFEDEDTATLEYEQSLSIWWEKPDLLYPFLVYVDGHAGGFALVGGSPGHAPKGCDFYLHEFFVLRPFRGAGVGQSAAAHLFNELRGVWALRAMPNNPRALAFWRKVLAAQTSGNYAEETGEDRIIFRFTTGTVANGA